MSKMTIVNEANLLGGENTGGAGETAAAPEASSDDDGGDGDSDPARPPSLKEKASRIGTRKARKTEQKIIPDNSTLDLFGQESPPAPAPTPAPTPCPASAVAAQDPPRAQLIPDLEEAKRFLDYLYDDSDARLSFQTFDDDKNRKSKHLANIYHGTLDQCAPRITDLQQQQAGAFLMVNGGDFKGRSAKNVTTVRCLFADTDGAPLAPLKSLKPHAIIESSPGNWHVYWRVSDCDLAEFAPAQRAIAAKFGTDSSVCDLPRVLRLPGFYHQKSTPFQTRIVEISGHDPYPMKEIRAGLGIQNAPPYQQTPINAALPQEPIYASPATVADLRSALCFLDSDDRTLWVAIGHALKTIGNLGKGLFFEWSQKSDKYDAGDIATEWRGFQPTQTNYKAVFKAAQDAGWVNPLSNAAGRGEAERLQSEQERPQRVGLAPFVVPMTNLDDDGEIPFIVQQWLPCGQVTLLAGHGGGGKSYVALSLAIHVALGRQFGELAVAQCNVIFFSGEDENRVLRYRVKRLCNLLNVSPGDLFGKLTLVGAANVDPALHREQKRPIPGEGMVTIFETAMLYDLKSLAESTNAGLVVVDNASDVFDDDEIKRARVRTFIRSLRADIAQPERAVLLLAHINKTSAIGGRTAGSEDYSGSTAWHNSVRSRLSLTPNADGGFSIEHKKVTSGVLAAPVNVMWVDGVPAIEGTTQTAGLDFAKAFAAKAEATAEDARKDVIVLIVQDFDLRGETITTATSGSAPTFKVMRNVKTFPKGLSADRLTMLLRDLESEGRIFRRTIRTGNRKFKDVFTCIPEPEIAPDGTIEEKGEEIVTE